MGAEPPPVAARAQLPAFVAACSLAGLRAHLPLRWPTPADTPPCPKQRFRSHYAYLGWDDLDDPATWEHLSDFDLVLRLVDFSGLRPVLAQRLGWTSARGWTPFDPVSLFLLCGWQLTQSWTRSHTLHSLRDPRYADYAQRFGFHDGLFPSEGGLRYFLTTLGHHSDSAGQTILVDADQHLEVAQQHLNDLIAQSVHLIRAAGALSPEAWRQALLCPDGMLHAAASHLNCTQVTDTCYAPTTPDHPRPCPAKDKGRESCTCDTPACAQVCRRATPRDPQARYVWYAGANSSDAKPPPEEAHSDAAGGHGVYGYRSLPVVLADTTRRFSLVLLDDVRPANEREETPAAALLLQLEKHYPDLHVEAVAGDAGYGYDLPLRLIYRMGARRVVDLRAHPTDADKLQWPLRGYDDRGRPVCAYGYAFRSNGFDFERRRHKWVCAQACDHGATPLVCLPEVCYPPQACPYRAPDRPQGRVFNVGERFGDGSIRLVRDVTAGSATWKGLYHRGRNAVEGRHAGFERWGLKRLGVYGVLRGKAVIFQADVWGNLCTLARLVREATAATGG